MSYAELCKYLMFLFVVLVIFSRMLDVVWPQQAEVHPHVPLHVEHRAPVSAEVVEY